MKIKKPHRKFLIPLYIISYLMMLPPFVYIGNKESITLGLPTLITWLVFWSLVMTVGLAIQFKLDKKCEAKAEKAENTQQ